MKRLSQKVFVERYVNGVFKSSFVDINHVASLLSEFVMLSLVYGYNITHVTILRP